ncbi:probable disease resistance protein RPP1 isoform X2 [Raphanus sativus]|uniref:ADP-ribosyl cyclase/cyclic ADP-ribose hydrolase n=1 Tax=Raphanus sativus TaxID=3726 RepID=A0A9W3CBF4_RAPSA|nr:probable disease resistance protein RPP1 isoform X2 [Raphanus sativus]
MDFFLSRTNVVSAAAISLLALLGTRFFNRRSKSHQENKTMASSSITLLDPPSSLPRNWKHHVFPSFHGADVRKSFLSHIVKEFKSKGIDLFIDNDLERSKSIGPELVEAIKGSRIAIVLLSKNYASSTWCLNELVEIVKCKEEFGQTVMPLFYEVDPTDIKKQKGYFGEVFRKTCKGKRKEEIQRWKHALTEVAQITGYHSTNWETEAKMIEDTATDVSNKLNLSAPCSDFDSLVGMESHMTRMEPLLQLDSSEVRKIGIWGSPGIGKTTIARSLFNRHSQEFQLSVFVDNIKKEYAIPSSSDDYSVKLYLQKQFMSRLTNNTCVSISHLGVVEDRLKDKKVLVVLDDVDHLEQVEAMAKETYWFGPGSRIIIVTQDQRVLRASGVNYIHEVNLPSYDEALQMFCMYAFDQKYPKDGFQELAWKVKDLVGCLPLGLRVMGSYFRGMSEQEWTEALPRLRTHLDIDGEITSILKFSYDALGVENQSLFLHIACFFHYEKVDIVKGCLEKSVLDVTHGLRVLVEKSLIYIEEERIKMAELLLQLGRKIVREESIREPGKRQFLHDANDIDEVLSDDKTDSRSVIGIYLWRRKDIACTNARAFKRLYNLRFLETDGKCINPQSINYISQNLRVLIWEDFEIPCFPSSFNPKFLVRLVMHYSELEKLWEGTQPLSNLKWMDLSYSRRLKELPDLSTAVNLQELSLRGCESLVKLPSSIGNAIDLRELDLRFCSSLTKLPSSMRNLGRLSTLVLSGCSELEVNLANINLESLDELNLSGCSSLKSYHESSTDIEVLDPWRRRKSRLRQLVINGMEKLVSLPQLPDSLWLLDAEICESLERLDCSFRNPDIRLNFRNCFKLNQEARDLIIRTPTNEYAVFPAEEVPPCFTHRSFGSSLTVKLNQLTVGKSIKFKACVIYADVGDDRYRWDDTSVYCTITSGRNASIAFKKRVELFLPGHLFTFEVEVETEEVTSTELLFDFDVTTHGVYEYDCDHETWKPCKIKGCGIIELLEVPLLSFRDGDEDCEPSDTERFADDNEDYEPSDIEI